MIALYSLIAIVTFYRLDYPLFNRIMFSVSWPIYLLSIYYDKICYALLPIIIEHEINTRITHEEFNATITGEQSFIDAVKRIQDRTDTK